MTTTEFLKVKKVAALLDVRDQTVYQMIWSGKLEAIRVGAEGRGIRVSKQSVERFIQENKVQPRTAPVAKPTPRANRKHQDGLNFKYFPPAPAS